MGTLQFDAMELKPLVMATVVVVLAVAPSQTSDVLICNAMPFHAKLFCALCSVTYTYMIICDGACVCVCAHVLRKDVTMSGHT